MAHRTALIDADVLAYRAAYTAQKEIDWDGDGDVTVDVNFDLACRAVDELVLAWTELVKCENQILVQSDPARGSFRHQIHPHYKAHRSKKPVALVAVEEYIRERYDARYWEGLEGDDAIGIMATRRPDDCVVVSTDKDMKTLPVRICLVPGSVNSTRLDKMKLTEEQADYNWMLQTIVGDPVDNFKGAPGIGKRGAEAAFDEAHYAGGDLWDAVVAAFHTSWLDKPRWHSIWVHPGHPADEALMNARCARILRDGDYKAGKVRLWEPDGPGEWI